MDFDNKILKYKQKKKKIMNKINDLLVIKNKEKVNFVAKIFNKTQIFSEIINNFIVTEFNNYLFIVVVGFGSVGKSTFIKYLEDYFSQSYTKIIMNIVNFEEINNLNKILSDEKNFVDEKKIVYIETNPDLINNIYNFLMNLNTQIKLKLESETDVKNIYIIYLIPINKDIYKNRLINIFFNLLKDESLNNSTNLANLNDIVSKKFLVYNKNIIDGFINILNKYPLSDNDFEFLDLYMSEYYDVIETHKFNNDMVDKIDLKFYF